MLQVLKGDFPVKLPESKVLLKNTSFALCLKLRLFSPLNCLIPHNLPTANQEMPLYPLLCKF